MPIPYELLLQYETKFGKEVPRNMMHNVEWVKKQMGQEQAPQVQEKTSAPEEKDITKVSEKFTEKRQKEILYGLDEGKGYKCDITGDPVVSGEIRAKKMMNKEGEICFLIVRNRENLIDFLRDKGYTQIRR